MIHYVCKYTPLELFRAFGEDCAVLEEMPENFELSDQIAHANLCGFGKSVIQAVLEGKVEELVLVNCCDSMRRVYDIVESTGRCRFLYMLDLPHDDNECEKEKFAGADMHVFAVVK
jgi:benzoyl-CoA reductase/2-hydroxyglutaryl-CoA dehydratase subunit BcrC/BadD/HgdB